MSSFERAVLVGLNYTKQSVNQTQEYLDELAFLALTSGAKTIKRFTQSLPIANPKTFVGKGKLIEVRDFIKENQIQISQVVQKLYGDDTQLEASSDVDQSLYEGFVDNADRRICNQIQNLSENELSNFHPKFNDKRLGKLLMYFKARNYPNSLSDDEKEDWFEIVQSRVQAGDNGYLSIEDYYQKLSEMRQQHPEKSKLWNELESFAERFL